MTTLKSSNNYVDAISESQISIKKQHISINIKNDHALITYLFNFECRKNCYRYKFQFDITISPTARVHSTDVDIDGVIYKGHVLYMTQCTDSLRGGIFAGDNEISLSQPFAYITNIIRVDGIMDTLFHKNNQILSLKIVIEQAIENQMLDVQVLRNWDVYGIKKVYDHDYVTFDVDMIDMIGIKDIDISSKTVTKIRTFEQVIIDEKIIDSYLDSDLTYCMIKGRFKDNETVRSSHL